MRSQFSKSKLKELLAKAESHWVHPFEHLLICVTNSPIHRKLLKLKAIEDALEAREEAQTKGIPFDESVYSEEIRHVFAEEDEKAEKLKAFIDSAQKKPFASGSGFTPITDASSVTPKTQSVGIPPRNDEFIIGQQMAGISLQDESNSGSSSQDQSHQDGLYDSKYDGSPAKRIRRSDENK